MPSRSASRPAPRIANVRGMILSKFRESLVSGKFPNSAGLAGKLPQFPFWGTAFLRAGPEPWDYFRIVDQDLSARGSVGLDSRYTKELLRQLAA
jgi:hypothetical protein